MAEPKKRTNKSKTNMRRMHHHQDASSNSFCSECHEPVMPHHACLECGSYNGKKVIEKEAPTIVASPDSDAK